MRGQVNNKQPPNRANQIFFWALTGDYNSLKAALEGGMSVNVIDPVTTDSPLMIACRKGHTEIVRLCLEYGAKNDPHPEFGQTALHASIAERKFDSARVLLEVAAESDANHIISNLSDPSGQTPLHTACYVGSTALIELLLHHGAEMSSVDNQGQTSLHLCASSGVKASLAMLIDHGGDDLINIQDKGGNTALHHATFHGRLDCVRLLLETAADVCIRNFEGLTPYNIASAQGHHQIGLLLLEYRDIYNGAPSTNHSNLPTPSKAAMGSLVPTPLHYQTPQSISKYGRATSHDYAYSPSNPYNMPEYGGAEVTDSPERVTVLNIRPQSQPNANRAGGTGMGSTSLSLKAPSNLLSSMYGMNNGMENMDSINNFLPRPHTVSSPSMSNKNGSLHAAALRGQSNTSSNGNSHVNSNANSGNSSPIVYSNPNPLFQNRNGGAGNSNGAYFNTGTLTQGSMAQHNKQYASNSRAQSIAISSPMSPNSEPTSLENGAGGSGYKVLTKQHNNVLSPPSLSRQSTESLASRQSNGTDPGPGPVNLSGKIQLFDGIQTYNKSSIIPTQEHHQRRHSADSPSGFQPYTHDVHADHNNQHAPHQAHQGYNMLNNKHIYDSAQYGNTHIYSNNAPRGVVSSQSTSAIDSMAHQTSHQAWHPQHSHHSEYDNRQYAASQMRNNYMSSIATDQDNLVDAEQLPYYTDSAPATHPQSPQATPQKSYHAEYEATDAAGGATTEEVPEFADPIEEFAYLDIDWKVYLTEENEIYYLDMANEHSQWEDPRIHGIVYHLDGPAESPSGKFSEPPKSPSPKALEKSGGGKYGSFHFRGDAHEESPRVRDIKPIKLNWEVGKEDGVGVASEGTHGAVSNAPGGFTRVTNKTRRVKAQQVNDYSSDSSDDEIKSAVQVRYPKARSHRPTSVGLIDAEDSQSGGDDDIAVIHKRHSPGDAIHLAQIIVVEKLEDLEIHESSVVDDRPQTKSQQQPGSSGKENRGNKDGIPLFQRSNSDLPFDSAEQLERGRIKLLAQEFNKAGGKPLSPAASLTSSSSFTNGSRTAAAPPVTGVTEPVGTSAKEMPLTSKPVDAPPTKATAAPPSTTSTTAAAATAVTREDANQYIKLVVSGKTLQEVGELMDRDGRSQQFKLQVLAWADEATILEPIPVDSCTSPSAKQAATETTAAAPVIQETIAMLKEDPVLMKYAKMLGMGVPAGNVLMKLKMENIEISQRNRLMRAAGQEEEVDPNAAAAAVPSASAPAGAMTRRPSANMQNLHWNMLPADKLKNSIWSQASGNPVSDIAETDLLELERLFGAQKDTGGKGSFATTRNIGALADSQKEALQLRHLEKKRAQNIVIGLNPFKSLGSHVDLLKALCSLNDLGGKVTADHIDNFRNLLPTEAELKRIDKINGSKHPAELFFQAVMVFYPELPVRLNCFAACLNFNGNCVALLVRTKKLINACNQVLSSNNLARLLQRMLAVGNIMNEGTRRGGASGFTLDSLMKMVNTKGVDKKTSVLDYVVKSLYDKQEESVLTVIEDLNLVEESAKVSGNEVLKEFAGVRSALDGLEEAYTANQKKNEVPSFNSPTAKKLIDEFSSKLEVYLSSFQGQMQECERSKLILRRKIDDIIKYFGEDPVSCDTVKIFGTLQEFLRAIAFSKAAVEWKLYRSQSM